VAHKTQLVSVTSPHGAAAPRQPRALGARKARALCAPALMLPFSVRPVCSRLGAVLAGASPGGRPWGPRFEGMEGLALATSGLAPAALAVALAPAAAAGATAAGLALPAPGAAAAPSAYARLGNQLRS